MPTPTLDQAASQDMADDLAARVESGDVAGAVRLLGASGDGRTARFGFWTPGAERGGSVDLELLVPTSPVDITALAPHEVRFDVARIPMIRTGEFAVTVAANVVAGTRHEIGAFYQARVTDADGNTSILLDPLALSTPFGAFAPSEVMDPDDLFGSRQDAGYFAGFADDEDTIPRLRPFTNILQVHVPTATASGTLAELADTIGAVGERVRSGADLSPADQLWLDVEAIQLMPVEPTIRREAGPYSWKEIDRSGGGVEAMVRRPTTTNWGYDVIIGGSAAVNPTMLASGRPHELADLAAVLHSFPNRPIKLIFDVVYGHADNQAIGTMPDEWFTGPDMYGQHLDYRNPIVRAHLLEMQRRKMNYGADGIRIDGAQDFTWWDEDNEVMVHDDAFLEEMSDIVQEVAGVRYRPWMIFEDGRPWPRADWELASSYREVTKRQPFAFQWGPLTFAHNTPFLFTFWVSKWWRMREITEVGSMWISGCSNHDTLRRGSQVDPAERINTYLGSSLPEVIVRAYDHPASTLLFHGFLPGVPMDFLQSVARAPWSFIRNTDHRYAIKVWAEEARFLDWRVPAALYDQSDVFARMKDLGFGDVGALRAFMEPLRAAVEVAGDDIEPVVAAARLAPHPDGWTVNTESLIEASHRWMDDVHDLCNVSRWVERLDADQVAFDRAVRRFRLDRPWLMDDLGPSDRFDYLHPTSGAVVVTGRREGPDGTAVAIVANLEGAPALVVPSDAAGEGEWSIALTTPDVSADDPSAPVVLTDGEGLVLVSAPASSAQGS